MGNQIYNFACKLWPLNRSLTGDGVRKTLLNISKKIPNLKIKSVASGTKVFDWTIPKEWYVKEAYIITPDGEKICDFSKNNLHLVGYSKPFKGKLELKDLKKNLFSLPKKPTAIPYVTSYYEERWGFCISDKQLKKLKKGMYKVVIDTKLFNGVLNYGELKIKGKSKKEIFLSTYVCHPSMANNELSGPVVLTYLSKWLQSIGNTEFSYRIIFIPETIGSITYLSKHYKEMKRKVIAGFNVTCVGDNRAYSYLPSRDGKTISDDIAKHVLKWIEPNYKKYTWLDRGSDERQYCAPGIDLPIATISRTKYEKYPEYHTSLDDLENVVSPEGLDGGYWAIRKAIEAIEKNKKFVVNVFCEPQMGKRGLYPNLSENKTVKEVKLFMDFISLCDGENSLLNIAEKINIPIWKLYSVAEKLQSHRIIKLKSN